MRTFSYWSVLVLGLCWTAGTVAELPPAPATAAEAEREAAPVADADADAEAEADADAEASPSEEPAAAGAQTAEAEVDADEELAGSEDSDADSAEAGVEVAAPATSVADESATPTPDAADESAACLGEPIELRRYGKTGSLALQLTDCRGEPNLAALSALSALAQPLESARLSGADADADADLKLLNPQLLARVQRLVDHFPAAGVEIVSGYRPHARVGSRHHSGDALDLHIDGVDNFELSEFARTLEATGVGYYPNSTFVHIDVRDAQAYWIDRSAPGERAKYDRKAAAAVLAGTPVQATEPKREEDAADEAEAKSGSDSDAEPDSGSDSDAEPDSGSDSGSVADSDSDSDSVPTEAAPTDAEPTDGAAPDPELQALADRALLVMNQALGLDGAHGAS